MNSLDSILEEISGRADRAINRSGSDSISQGGRALIAVKDVPRLVKALQRAERTLKYYSETDDEFDWATEALADIESILKP